EELYGYGPYLERVPERPGQIRHTSDNREEAHRAAEALKRAAAGACVAIVSGGDPGVFAMAAAVCEQIETGAEAWRRVELAIVPGHAVGRVEERVAVAMLETAGDQPADMATLIIVGSAETRVVLRSGQPPLVYTPRAAAKVLA